MFPVPGSIWRTAIPARSFPRSWLALLSGCALLVMGCSSSSGGGGNGGGDNTGSTTRTYVGTQSPGYLWSFTLTDSEWSASNESQGFTYAGTVETMDNRFQLLTVTESNDPETDTDGSAAAFALEVPGVVLMVQPKGDSDSQMIVGVAEGDCPTENANYNWITIPPSEWSSVDGEAFGTASFAWSGSTATIDVQTFLLEGEGVGGVGGDATCADGVMDLDEITLGVTEAGTLIGSATGENGGGFVGLLQPDVDVEISALTASGIEYRGLVFEYERLDQDDTKPVWAEGNSGGGLLAGDYDDFESNDENRVETSTVVLEAEDPPGRISGTVQDEEQTLVFAVGQVEGRYFIFGIGNSAGDSTPYNVLLIQVED